MDKVLILIDAGLLAVVFWLLYLNVRAGRVHRAQLEIIAGRAAERIEQYGSVISLLANFIGEGESFTLPKDWADDPGVSVSWVPQPDQSILFTLEQSPSSGR